MVSFFNAINFQRIYLLNNFFGGTNPRKKFLGFVDFFWV